MTDERKNNLPKVLYVEDDDISREVVAKFLQGVCIVDTAEDSETALKKVQGLNYNVVLIDMNLGKGLDGLELCKTLKKRPEYKHVPLIAVTAYAMREDEKLIRSGGCTHYIAKPFDRRTLIKLVTSAMEEFKER